MFIYAQYELDIDDELELKENITLTATDDNDNQYFRDFKYYIPLSVNSDDYSVYLKKYDSVSYYNMVRSEDKYVFKNKFDVDGYIDSTIVNNAFEYISITDVNDLTVFSTSSGFLLFDSYNNLEDVTIVIKSKLKLVETNADYVEKHKYTWNINKENAYDKYLYLKVDRGYDDRTLWEKIKDGEYINNFTIFLSIFLGIGIIIFLFKKKGDRRNKV